MNRITTRLITAGILLLLLPGCGYEESAISKTRRQMEEAQEKIMRKLQEQEQMEKRLEEARKAREESERRLKENETTSIRKDRIATREERSLSLWKAGAAFFFVLAVMLLFVGAAAGSSVRKEVSDEQNS